MSKIRIGIISDTHNLLRPEVIEILKTCTHILHAGDITCPEILDELSSHGFLYAVRGNNDRYLTRPLQKTLTFTIGGIRFFMVHDKRDVGRNGLDAQVIIYGHSHIYSEETINNRLWLNPGSCGYKRFGREVTMAVMEIEHGQYTIEKIVIPTAI